MYDILRLDDNRKLVGGTSFAGALLPVLDYGLSLFLKVRKAMSELKRMRPIERIRYLRASYKLTVHDAKLFGNDAVVHNVATQLFLAMEEHGILKITAAFRAALAMLEHQAQKEVFEEVEHARRANDG